MSTEEQLKTILAQIMGEVGDLSVPTALFGSKTFRELRKAPLEHLEAAKLVLARWDVDEEKKIILAYALQDLPLGKFVDIVGYVAIRVERNEIAPVVLERLAFPAFEWGGKFVEQYDQPTVRALIERIAAQEKISEAKKKYIREQVLTGQAKENLLDYRELHGME